MMQLRLSLIGITGPALMLATAFSAQYFGELDPCTLCIWQRWPHLAAIVLGLCMLLTGRRAFGWLAATALLVGSAIAAYHVGVEQHWWKGLGTCSGVPLGQLTGSQLLDISAAKPAIRCDDVVWSLLGLSMAAWNGLASVGIAAIWMLAASRPLPAGLRTDEPADDN